MTPTPPTAPSAEDVAGLVAKLRQPAPKFGLEEFDPTFDTRHEAATLIEFQSSRLTELEAENARLTRERDEWRKDHADLYALYMDRGRERDVANDAREAHARCAAALIDAAELALSTSQAERDRAVVALERIAEHPSQCVVGPSTYGVGWAFGTVKSIAREALRTLTPAQEASR